MKACSRPVQFNVMESIPLFYGRLKQPFGIKKNLPGGYGTLHLLILSEI